MVTLEDFIDRLESWSFLVQHNKQYHRKITAQQLSFEWSHLRISSTDSKVRSSLYSMINSTTGWKVLLNTIHLNGPIIRVHPQIQVEPPYTT